MTLPKTIVKALKPLGKFGYFIQKHSPEILTGLGICGYAGAVVLASKAPEKAKEARDGYLKDGDKKKFIKGYVKAWAPTAGLFVVSTGCVVGGHRILHGRYIAVGGALEATRRAFSQYRERVKAKEGENADICYRYGLDETVDLKESEDGTEVVRTFESKAAIDPSDYYIHVFDERNEQYVEGDPRGNILRLKRIKEELNILFDCSIDGRMTFREVLIRSGFRYALREDDDLAKFAGRVGYSKHSDRGDDYISFGPMFEKLLSDQNYFNDYVMGRTPPLILEFNCDGDIYG